MDLVASDPPPPPPMKRRRSTYDLLCEQRQRHASGTSSSRATETTTSTAIVETSSAIVVDTANETREAYRQDSSSINDEVGVIAAQDAECAEEAARFEAAASHRSQQLEAKWRRHLEELDAKTGTEPVLTGSEDICSDFSVKSGLRIGTPYSSFKWMRQLPLCLRSALCRQGESSLKGAARDAVLHVIAEHLKGLMGNPDRALKWMECIAACLVWYEVEGPTRPSTSGLHASSAVPEERSMIRRVEEWNEAYRSLVVSLRQGLISCFVIAGEKFTVTVFDQHPAPLDDKTQRPSKPVPCAVMCPSQDEIRNMFQENHVSFKIADVLKTASKTNQPSNDTPTTETAIVPIASSVSESNNADLRELRRDGEKVLNPDEINRVKPPSTALLFEGDWSVHGMLDVLRQYLLDAPLAASPTTPRLLPRLLAPAPFSHAAVHSAEVVKTQSLRGEAAAAAFLAAVGEGSATATSRSAPAHYHNVELSGCFFPNQVRRLLELLRVPLPSFTCRLACEPRHSTGINAFTRLGMYRLEGVRCDSRILPGGAEGEKHYNWEFELAGG